MEFLSQIWDAIIKEQIIPVVVTTLSGVILAVGVKVIASIKREMLDHLSLLQGNSKEAQLRRELLDKISIAVNNVNKTVVEQLKKDSADGKLSDSEKEQLMRTTKAEIYNLLNTDTMNLLKSLGDGYLDMAIELAVSKFKK